ncbi:MULTISPECIES: DUF6026 family protein [Pseudomonas]|jgi:cell division septum initiation protein DivIVA|uniref:Uncharacterized protein n=1 Tax=Pseudomonas lundensis TaxID=86185 RepID=A0AAP6YXV2_9PSED|nr:MULTISPECIES: DUF6026 family protein [Pseudomonas]AOZ14254.1 hypothetical protein AA042_17560 [Pseudomonas lundensis]KMM84490.1 hypothetical protein TU74_20500 [Pseudomonas lundensis]MBS5840844.1 hypothetical protein [Pseudomonas sp.]MCT8951656.1 DUF6026 family protein [Pseudomonas lundensis]NLU02337.1 hypothetical protein [Pseudomonas lundensis]
MTTVLSARPAQTLYVTIRRDELRQLKDDNAQLLQQVEHLRQQLALGQSPLSLTRSAAHLN